MKKWMVFIFGVLIVLAAVWQFQGSMNHKTDPTGNKSSSQTAPGKQANNNIQTGKPEVYEILGRSDKLTAQQWTEMLQWRNDAKDTASKNPGEVFINGDVSKPLVALTFDDGPDETITPAVLAVLNQYQVQATFFMKANQINQYRDLVRKIYADGYQIASHAYSHQELNKMNPEDITKEIIASDQAFARIIGVIPAMIRPPFGAVNQDVLDVCRQNQEKVILWSIDTLDWSQPESEHISQNVLDNVRPGEIILLHSCQDREATVQALPLIIEGLQSRGYQLVDLSVLLQMPAYKQES